MSGRPVRAAKRLLRGGHLNSGQIREACQFIVANRTRRNPRGSRGEIDAWDYLAQNLDTLKRRSKGKGFNREMNENLFQEVVAYLGSRGAPKERTEEEWSETARVGTREAAARLSKAAVAHQKNEMTGLVFDVVNTQEGLTARDMLSSPDEAEPSEVVAAEINFIFDYIRSQKVPQHGRVLLLNNYADLMDNLSKDLSRAKAAGNKKLVAETEKDIGMLERAKPQFSVPEPLEGGYSHKVIRRVYDWATHAKIEELQDDLRVAILTWLQQRRKHGPSRATTTRKRDESWGA